MLRGRHILLVVPAIALLIGALTPPAMAKVTVKGKVEYWDQLANSYRPARDVLVEVEGDWLDFDPQVQTNAQGHYVATQRNPYWGDFDINIEVYAETPNLIEVYEDVFEAFTGMYPYHATSKTTKGIKGGQTATINLKIGGPQDNVDSVWTRTVAETANAFCVHQEMYGHYATLKQMGFVSHKFHEFEAIVPAAGLKTSYYNHFTGYINLCVKSAGYSGLSSWATLPAGNDYFVPTYKDFPMMVRHEYSHAIHDVITGTVPLAGLNMPADHSPLIETNRWLAFTEGWAEFLPLTTINAGGQFEPTRSATGWPAAINIPIPSSPGGHYAWEGEIAALLWDLWDPAGQAEILRHPATKAAGGQAVPQQIVDKQTWTDRIADPKLAKIKKAIQSYVMLPFGPVDTIEEFLGAFKAQNPALLHAVKAIVFNRDIIKAMPTEKPPYISGTPTLARNGPSVSLKCTVSEPEAEDRPFVSVSVWRQLGSGVPVHLTTSSLKGGWQGSNRPTTLSFKAPASAAGSADALWVIVSDEMMPTAYRLVNPPTDRVVAVLPPSHWFNPPTIDPRYLHLLTAADRQEVKPVPQDTIDPGKLSRAGEGQESESARSLRDVIGKASDELQGYARRSALAVEVDRSLYRAARLAGDISGPEDPPELSRRSPAARAPTPVEGALIRARPPQAYEQWAARVADGQAQPPSPSGGRQGIAAYQAKIARQAQDQQQASRRAQALLAELQSAMASADLRDATQTAREDTLRTVQMLREALNGMARDSELLPKLQRQSAVVARIAGGPVRRPGVTQPAVAPGTVKQVRPLSPGAQAISESFGTDPLEGWHLVGGARVAPAAQGRALVFDGPGHGLWQATQAQTSSLAFRYRHGAGLGEVVMCGTGEPPNHSEYRVRFDQAGISVRRLTRGTERVLGSGRVAWRPGAWVNVAIQVSAGTIAVSVDGQRVLGVTDANPLPGGGMAFGCLEGSGFGYDDIALTQGSGGRGRAQPERSGTVQPPVALMEPLVAVALRTENFDAAPLEGWELSAGARLIGHGRGQALSFTGPGHAFWVGPAIGDFTLTCRYRHSHGAAEVIVRAWGEPPESRAYHVRFEGDAVILIRRAGEREREIAAGELRISPGTWHDLSIKVTGGTLELVIAGQRVLLARDNQPLKPGIVGLGCLAGEGFAFDDLRLAGAAGGRR